MPSKLKFRLIEASSEERGFEAKSLNFQSPFSNGWKSSKSCSYPQQLVLQLENRSNVRKIQIMVHHQLIPEIIEICAVDARGAGNPVVQCLGHVRCMDSQQNSYKSREMKSIYVDVTISCIILNLHRNFTNPSNPHNQVSIVAINLLGHCPPSQNGDQSYSPLDSLEYLMTNDHQIIQIICSLRKKIQYLKVKNDVMDSTEIDSTCSSIIKLEEVSKQLVSMELRKMKMLDAADNVGAQLVKRKMDQLRLKTYEDLHLRRVIEREIAQEEDDDDFCNSVSIQIVPYEESNFRLKNVKTGSELRTTVGDGNDVMKHDSDVEIEDSNLTSNQIPDKKGEDKKSEKAKLHKTYNISKQRGLIDDVHKTKNIFKNNENNEDANFNMMSLANLLPNNVYASAKKYPDDYGGVSLNMNPEMHSSNDNLVVSGGGGRLPSKSPKELKTQPDDHSKSIIRTSKKNKNSPQSKKSTRRSSFTINKNENDDGDKMKMSEEEGSKTRNITDNSDLKNQKLSVRMEGKGYIAAPVETSAYASYEDRPLPTHRNKMLVFFI
ncbi:hypothetical protein HELRODRAFT_189836 [Helobdella robusta]|uniref:Centrosomal protein CEP104 N-terminal domain-containing protein n=1 Tax=Helobdella robusta TaxID=6412 RepID=T1FRE7_HELRO|nr:hypothetical protein HELRODRAFT_189836 [Helobdella robusta]ESN90330.1 hypothetical protein HELRODRAFT_189836 [Helobdella robusta]